MEELPDGCFGECSVEERRLEQTAALLSVRRLAEKLSNELNFDRLRYASGVLAQKNPPASSSLPEPSPPSTPSPLHHPVPSHYADADSVSAASPPSVPLAPPAPPPPPPPPPPRFFPTAPLPSTRFPPAIYATVYSSPSTSSASPSPPSILYRYPHSLSSSSCPSLKSVTQPSAAASPFAPGLSSHLRQISQCSLDSLRFDDEVVLKQPPEVLLDTGEDSPSVAEHDVKESEIVIKAPAPSPRVCLDVSVGGEDAEQPIQSSGGEARDFIMDRFLPAARAVAEGDPPDGRSSSFAVNPSVSAVRRRESSSFVESNVADEFDANIRKSCESRRNGAAAQLPSAKPRVSRARNSRLDQRDDVASKGGLFKSCGLLCLGLKTGVVHGCRRAVSSTRTVPISRNKAEDLSRHVDEFCEAEDIAISSQFVDFIRDSDSRTPPPRDADVVPQAKFTSSNEEDVIVRPEKATLPNRCNQMAEPTSGSFETSCSKSASFRGVSPRYRADFKDSSIKYSTNLRGSSVHEEASTSGVARHLHYQADSKDIFLTYDRTSTRDSPVHDQVSSSLVAGRLHCQADSKDSSPVWGMNLRGCTVPEQVNSSLMARHLHCGADSKESSPTYGTASSSGSRIHEQLNTLHIESRLHSQADSEDCSSWHGRSFSGSPVHEQASTHLLAKRLHIQADCEDSSSKYDTSCRGGNIFQASTTFVVSHISRQADSRDSSPKHGSSSRGSPLHEEASTSFMASPHSEIDSELDEPVEFYDAPSRFGSQTNTPVHPTYGSRSPTSFLNKTNGPSDWAEDWTNDEMDSADGIFNHFETPYISDSDDKSQLSVSSHSRESWFSPESLGHKSSRLSQRVGKVLRVDTGVNQPRVPEMNGFSTRLPEQGVSGDHVLLMELEQVLELGNGSFSRLVTPRSTNSNGHKGSAKPGLVSPILLAKCQKRGIGNEAIERKPPNGMGWPLGISRVYTDSTLNPSHAGGKSKVQHVQGADVPVPPLPPAPSGSWLKKTISSKLPKSTPSAAFSKVNSAKKQLQCSTTETARMRWESMVKSSHAQPGHLRFSEELLHRRPS